MEQNNELDKRIKNSFESKNQSAPDRLWSHLSAAMDANAGIPEEDHLSLDVLDEKVKESFKSINSTAPRHVWPAINRQLNLDRVWQGIGEELDKKRPVFWTTMRIAAAILLLVLTSTGTYVWFTHSIAHQHIALGVKEVAKEQSLAINNKMQGDQLELDSSEIQTAKVRKHKLNATNASTSEPLIKRATISKTPHLSTTKRVDATFIAERTVVVSPENVIHINDASLEQSALQQVSSEALNEQEKQVSSHSKIDPTFQEAFISEGSDSTYKSNDDSNVVDESITSANTFALQSDTQQVHNSLALINATDLPLHQDKMSEELAEKTNADTTALPQASAEILKEEKEKNLFRNNRFDAGLIVSYNNSWLLNNETRSSYDKNSLIATDPTYKKNWAMALNYYLSEKNIIAIEVHIINKAGQQYKMFREGEYMKKDLELRYHKLYLQYQRNFLTYGKSIPSHLTIKAGGYGGYLQHKLGEIRQEESRYANIDYGIKLSLGQENRIGKIVIGYGLSGERGFRNVFRGTQHLPAEFNKTYILNVATYLNVRYIF